MAKRPPLTQEVANPAGRKFLYSVPNAAVALDISVSTLYDHIKAGTVRPVAFGGRTMITADELERVMRSLQPVAGLGPAAPGRVGRRAAPAPQARRE